MNPQPSITFLQFSTWLQSREYLTKIILIAVADFVLLNLAVFVAYGLRLSSAELPATGKLPLYVVAPMLSVVCAGFAGIYRSVSRHHSVHAEMKILLSQLAVPLIWALILLGLGTEGFARSVVGIYFVLSLLTLISLRRFAAWWFSDGMTSLPSRERISALIYGAGREGMLLAESLNRQGRYRPVAFIDTDYTLVGRSVLGLKVLSIDDMNSVMIKFRPQEVMIAKPRQSRANRRALVDRFLAHGLMVKTIPGTEEIVDGKIDVSALRPLRLEDLLGRDPVPPDRELMEKAVKDQVVLVTGAGGSIGSELVRQAASYAPRKIIMMDNSEFSLFEINRDMEGRMSLLPHGVELIPILADVTDALRMFDIMADHGVTVVLHAAAYKHVRMVQENASAGIRNNVLGTKTVAEAAIRQGVKLFILVSTDKAVRPTSIMGASKRVAEMVIQALAAEKENETIFAMVRFGNVLGSTGSVVPLFREQIAKGGPILVTHPVVTRYFMLIPEAAQLVIQAGAMAEGGEVFVLDMGEPIKIINLAETMIELAGMTRKTEKNPEGDIEIKFIGLCDGEKLHEELQIGRDIALTSHRRVMRSSEFYLGWAELKKELEKIAVAPGKETAKLNVKSIFRLAMLGS